jgi:hypothetical protein
MSKFDRIRLWATPVLVAVIVILIVAYLIKLGLIDPRRLGADKDSIAAIGSICTTLTVLVTGVFAYHRFFRGRTFTLRLDVNCEVTMVDGPHPASLGLLTVSVKNIGNVTVWDPQVSANVTYRYLDGRTVREPVAWPEDAVVRASRRRKVTAIDPGECSTFSAEIFIDKDVWALTQRVDVACGGHHWSAIRVQRGPSGRCSSSPAS